MYRGICNIVFTYTFIVERLGELDADITKVRNQRDATQKELKFKLKNNCNEQEDLTKRLGQLEKENKDLTAKNYELRAEANQVF